MKKMKKRLFLIIRYSMLSAIFLFGVLSIGGCKKDTPNATTYSVKGLWTGTLQNATSGPQPYNLSIKADGTVSFEGLVSNQEHFGVGTWTLTDSTLRCDVTTLYGFDFNVGIKQTLTAIFDGSNGTLSSGKWMDTYPSTSKNSGTFSLTKVN
jgi:hypothetical protein